MTNKVNILDHGYVEFIESWGSDERIVESARMSTGKGFNGWGPKCRTCGDAFVDPVRPCPSPSPGEPYVDCGVGGHMFDAPGDEKLLAFLYDNKHATPFEMAGMTIEVKAPIMVFREWHRHRTQCLAGDTMIHFESPKSERAGRRFVYKMPLAEVWRKWQETVRKDRPERQENALWSRYRIAGMRLRCVNEETGEVQLTHITNVIRGEKRQLLRVTTVGGKTIRASADHRFFTNKGWLRLEDAIARGALLAVERTAREMAIGWEPPLINEMTEEWRPVLGWEHLYEVSNCGRVRRIGGELSPKRGTVGAQGYYVVNLCRPGVQQQRTVHTLVLEAWKGEREPGQETRHLNHNRLDNRSSNLMWGSAEENANDRVVSDRQQRLSVGYEEIAKWKLDGKEVTYDISVDDPWHNFVADGFVVHNSYNEMSARYTPLPDENYVPSLDRLMVGGDGKNRQAGTIAGAPPLAEGDALSWLAELAEVYEHAEAVYQRGLRLGVPKELARLPVPVGRYSRMRASANLRNWLGFLALRSDKNPAAQWEIRQFANAVVEVVRDRFPRTCGLFMGSAS